MTVIERPQQRPEDLRLARTHRPDRGRSGRGRLGLTPEQVVRRNRRHPQHQSVVPRTAAHRRRPARDTFQTVLHISRTEWKQPGRRFGPAPQQNYPQRQTPLTKDARSRIYDAAHFELAGGGRDRLTARQHRRVIHKANRARAPFGRMAEGS